MVSPVMPSPSRLVARTRSRGGGAEQRFRELSAGGNQVLAIVEDQEDLPIADVVRERFADGPVRSLSNVEHRCHGLSQQARMYEGGQIDNPDAVGKTIEHVRGQFQRQARLAAPARAGERQQASGCHESQELSDFPIAPDEVRQRAREGCDDGGVAPSSRAARRGRRNRSDARSG